MAEDLGYDPHDKARKKVEEINRLPGVQVQAAAYNIALPGADLQSPFDVAVVMTTVLRPVLERALKSIFDQDFAGRIQILIGVDKAAGNRQLLNNILSPCPRNCVVTLLDPKYSTSIRHGGLHAAKDGGALRTVLSYLANSRYVAYLDDDNWWHKDHLSSMLAAIGDADWAFSHRWYVDPANGARLCIDRWESVGPGAGVFRERFGGFVDPSSLMIDKLRCEKVLRWWTTPLARDEKGMSADRNVFAALNKDYTVAATNKATCNYTLDPKDSMHPHRRRWIRETLQKKKPGAKAPRPRR